MTCLCYIGNKTIFLRLRWPGNDGWLCKYKFCFIFPSGAQGISPYSNLTQKKVQGSDFPEVYMTIPKPNDPYIPRIGSRYEKILNTWTDPVPL